MTTPAWPLKERDGLALALIGVDGAADEPSWSGADVPAEHAVRGFHGVTLFLRDAAPTAAILTEVFGFAEQGREGNLLRFGAGAGGLGRTGRQIIVPDCQVTSC